MPCKYFCNLYLIFLFVEMCLSEILICKIHSLINWSLKWFTWIDWLMDCGGGYTCALESRKRLLIFSFLCVGPGDEPQTLRLGSRYLYLLSHLTDPRMTTYGWRFQFMSKKPLLNPKFQQGLKPSSYICVYGPFLVDFCIRCEGWMKLFACGSPVSGTICWKVALSALTAFTYLEDSALVCS